MKINNYEKINIPLPKKLHLTEAISSNSISTQSNPITKLENHNLSFKDKQNNNENFKIQESGIMEKIIKLNPNKNNNDPNIKRFSSPIENKTIKLFKNINIESSPKKKSSDTSLNRIRPESVNDKNFHLLLHNINKNLNKPFTNLYDNNNIVSISSNNSLNKSSENKKNIFSYSREFNNLGYNINHNCRYLRRFSSSVNSSPRNLRNKFFLNNDNIINKNNIEKNNKKIKEFDLNSSLDYNTMINKNNKLNKTPPIYSNFINIIDNKINIYNENNYFENDLEKMYLLENKFKDILSKIIASQPAYNECFEFLIYYFNECIYNKLIFLFKNINNRRILTYIIKIELLCICLCYHVSYDKEFYKSIILLKSIFEKIHNNYLILIKLILHKTTIKNENYILYETLFNLTKKNLNIDLSKKKFEENNIIELLKNNINIIGNYYKLIIDDLYLSYYQPQNNLYKFPSSIYGNIEEKLKYLKEIISSFFFDAFLFNDNYKIDEINQFFNLFLFKISDPNGSSFLSYNMQNNRNFSDNNLKLNKNNNIPTFYLPKINPKYQYSLVLDLDETLIYLKRDLSLKSKRRVMILRPHLHEFLKKMKTLYELILFSFGTPEYVDPIVNIIEKKEKYFEYRLYRQHSNLDGKNYIKDLSKLGRDLKKVIIVDNMQQAFKLQINNGICIKAFYGDVVADRDTLKILSIILEKIRFDAEKTNDIRISLRKEKQIIITKISSNQDL